MIGAPRVALVGYSFGADVALGVADSRVAGWFAVAPPLRFGDFVAIASDARPKVLLVPELDQFSGPGRVSELTSGWSNVRVATLGGADHFLHGHSAAVAEAVRRSGCRPGGRGPHGLIRPPARLPGSGCSPIGRHPDRLVGRAGSQFGRRRGPSGTPVRGAEGLALILI